MKLSDPEVTRIAKALADPQRLALLTRVGKAGELTCSDLAAKCLIGQATVSHHLRELVNAGLLSRRKEGQFAYFAFEQAVFVAYVQEMRKRLGPLLHAEGS